MPELDTAVVKVVVPQPVLVGAAVPASVHCGRPSVIVSPGASALLHLKANAMLVAAPPTGLAIVKEASENAGGAVPN